MSKPIRIIPKLDIKGANLVKGIHLEGLRVLGNSYSFACEYYNDGADELIYQDVVASLYGRNSLNDLIKKTAENIFVPITVGGGIRSIDNIKNCLKAGADKVAINTEAIKNPQFINESANTFGASTIVLSVETQKDINGEYMIYSDNGREFTGIKLLNWIEEIQTRGAGEIILISIDRDGTGIGFDEDLIISVKKKIKVPLIVCGGPSNFNDLVNLYKKINIDGFALGSILHYSYSKKIMNKFEKTGEGNIEFISKSKNSIYHKFGKETLETIKNGLAKNNITVRNE